MRIRVLNEGLNCAPTLALVFVNSSKMFGWCGEGEEKGRGENYVL